MDYRSLQYYYYGCPIIITPDIVACIPVSMVHMPQVSQQPHNHSGIPAVVQECQATAERAVSEQRTWPVPNRQNKAFWTNRCSGQHEAVNNQQESSGSEFLLNQIR